MNSQTSLVAKNYCLQQWAVQINECQNRPKEMTINEWCEQHSITKANYYYYLRCIRQAYLDSVEPAVTEFVEMPIPDQTGNTREKFSVSAALNINQEIIIELLDSASGTFIKKSFRSIKAC